MRAFSLIVLTTVLTTALAAGSAHATDYYVATTGSDSNAGTMAAPWATLQKGVNTAVAGDTVYVRGGTYRVTTPATSGAGINFNKSGASDTNRIKYWAYPGEVPVFDFSGLTISTSGYTNGFSVSGSWLHFKGLEVANVPMNMYSNNGISVNNGSNDIFESLNLHHNSGTGLFIGNGMGGHLVLNSDAHDNYDPNSNQGMGQNADGFGVHYQTAGARTIIRGCRAWWNSDDGYDLINHEVSVTVEYSWAMGNGYANYGTTNPTDGNGNGFKMGSSKTGVRHLVQGNVAWKNKAAGFYANHSSGGNTWYNNTSFNNGTQYNMLASPPDMPDVTITLTGSLVHIMRNNLGMPNRNSNMTGVDTMFNSWDTALGITPATADFLSTTDPSVSGTGMSIESSGAIGPRAADGGMPRIDFLKLAAGSKMIDKGTDVGLSFVGTAPDLGAYEYGAVTTTGTGGVGGAGGVTGTGGASGRGGTGGGGASGRGGAGGTTGAVGRGGAGGSTTAGGGTGGSATGAGGTATAGAGGTGGTAVGTGGAAAGTSGATAGTGGAAAGTGGAAPGAGGASATGSAGTGAGQAGTGGDSPGASGCACAIDAPSGGAAPGSLAMLGGLSALLLRRRRRR